MEFINRIILLALAALMCGIYAADATSIDEVIRKAGNLTVEGVNYHWDDKNELALTEYDIVIPQKDYLQQFATPLRQKRTAGLRGTSKRWTDNTVYYQISDTFNYRERRIIKRAFGTWALETCLTFVEDIFQLNRNRIQVISHRGCWSYVGMVGGVQRLSIGFGCAFDYIVLHEIAHALGVYHEQTRPDRDSHVSINYLNIQSGMAGNFAKKSSNVLNTFELPYDYESIMHYGPYAYSKWGYGYPTIKTKDTSKQSIIGQAMALSLNDIKTVNSMYGCPDWADSPANDEGRDRGYNS